LATSLKPISKDEVNKILSKAGYTLDLAEEAGKKKMPAPMMDNDADDKKKEDNFNGVASVTPGTSTSTSNGTLVSAPAPSIGTSDAGKAISDNGTGKATDVAVGDTAKAVTRDTPSTTTAPATGGGKGDANFAVPNGDKIYGEKDSSSITKECGCKSSRMSTTETNENKPVEKQAPQTNDFATIIDAFKNHEQKTLEKLSELIGVIAPKKTEAVPSSKVDNTVADAKAQEFTKMREWFIDTAAHKNTLPSYSWAVNKDEIMQKYLGVNYDGIVPSTFEPTMRKIEAVTVTGGDMPQFFSNQIHRIPGGRIPLNVRPYCNFVNLDQQDRANWYKIDGMSAATITEGSEPSAASQTVTKITATPAIRGVYQKIGYSQVENAPFDLVQSVQDQMALSLIDDEAKDLLTTVYDAVTPTNWVNANSGAAITDDDVASMTFKRDGIVAAKRLIGQQGFDVRPGNLVLFIHPKNYQDLLLDTNLNNYYQYATPDITARGVLEMIYGVDIVVSTHVKAKDNATNDTYRNVMAVKGLAFGLASARNITFEAQRRNELQQILITATQRVKGAVIDETGTCRISGAQ